MERIRTGYFGGMSVKILRRIAKNLSLFSERLKRTCHI